MSERPRSVIDTNILISRMLLKDSLPARAVDLALEMGDLLASEDALQELADVLARPRFDKYVSVEDRQEFLRRYMQIGQPVSVHSDIRAGGDPGDDRILALAVDGQAGCILSGDEDLLGLHPFQGIAILNPVEFVSIYWTSRPTDR